MTSKLLLLYLGNYKTVPRLTQKIYFTKKEISVSIFGFDFGMLCLSVLVSAEIQVLVDH